LKFAETFEGYRDGSSSHSVSVFEMPLWRYLLAEAYHWYDMHLWRWLPESWDYQLGAWVDKLKRVDSRMPFSCRQDIRCYYLHHRGRKSTITLPLTEREYAQVQGER
jgi:hypothetical protein